MAVLVALCLAIGLSVAAIDGVAYELDPRVTPAPVVGRAAYDCFVQALVLPTLPITSFHANLPVLSHQAL